MDWTIWGVRLGEKTYAERAARAIKQKSWAKKSERGSDPSPFQQNPISPRPKTAWDITTPGKSKTTLPPNSASVLPPIRNSYERLQVVDSKMFSKSCLN